MKKTAFMLTLLLGVVLVVSGCGSTEVRETHEHTVYRPNVEPTPANPNNTNTQVPPSTQPSTPTSGNSDTPSWVNETRQAEGQGVIDLERFSNPAQAKAMAKRAAIMDARRNLLEQIVGLTINSQTTVKDMVTESDRIDGNTSGLIRNSYEVGSNFGSDGICTVTMEVKLYDVWEYTKTQHAYEK